MSGLAAKKAKSDLVSEFSCNQLISAGVTEDVQNLLSKVSNSFDENENLRFEHFLKIWKEMNFSLIYCGRESFRQLFEFTEDIFHLVKQRFLNDESFATRSASLYLLYALYFKQPISPRIRIRWLLEEVQNAFCFIDQCRDDGHWDLIYTWAMLIKDHAFYYSGSEYPMGFELAYSLENKDSKSRETRDDENPLQSEDCQRMISRIEKLHSKYQTIKKALKNPNEQDPGLALSSEDFPEQIIDIVENIHEPRADWTKQSGNILLENGLTIGDRRRKLRAAAFAQATNSPRLKGFSSEEETFEDKVDVKSSPEKVADSGQSRKYGKSTSKDTGIGYGRLDIDIDEVHKSIFNKVPKKSSKKKRPIKVDNSSSDSD